MTRVLCRDGGLMRVCPTASGICTCDARVYRGYDCTDEFCRSSLPLVHCASVALVESVSHLASTLSFFTCFLRCSSARSRRTARPTRVRHNAQGAPASGRVVGDVRWPSATSPEQDYRQFTQLQRHKRAATQSHTFKQILTPVPTRSPSATRAWPCPAHAHPRTSPSSSNAG